MFIPFPRGICPKVNVIARLEFELAFYDFAVHHFNYYTTRTHPDMTWWKRLSIRNFIRDQCLTTLLNGICTNQNLSKKIRQIKFSGALEYNRTLNINKKIRPCSNKQEENNLSCSSVAFPVDDGEKKKMSRWAKTWTMPDTWNSLLHMKVTVIQIVVGALFRLEYDLANDDSAVHRFNHYTTRTPPWCNDKKVVGGTAVILAISCV